MSAQETALLALRRPEHSGGDLAHQSARHQPLQVRAEIISRAGDHAALSCKERRQPCARDLLRAFLPVTPYESRLSRHFVKLRNRRTRAKSAHANTMLSHFLRKTFGKQQIKSLRSRIRRDVGHCLESRGGCDNQDFALAPRNHLR